MKPLLYASLAVAFCASMAGAFAVSALVRYADQDAQLALAKRQLRESEKALSATVAELAATKHMFENCKAILDDIAADHAHKKAQQAAMRTASVVGIGCNLETGSVAIGAYAIHVHRNQMNWCGPKELGFP